MTEHAIDVWVAIRHDGTVAPFLSLISGEEVLKTAAFAIQSGSGLPTTSTLLEQAGYKSQLATLTIKDTP
jgi:hypothetical protein